ncbi:hypothetical protein D358_00239 [Enterococcus faecalis RP2S-4]|uniref:Uncharacterized protein n=1 Tax=Enterococcus faecalis RP2S-4 TaxID=1244145 RepID=A0ABC9TMY3_ENTFL|nr:hypothetical protein D358_00239 [Enterococcus faecalis RP2S-4]
MIQHLGKKTKYEWDKQLHVHIFLFLVDAKRHYSAFKTRRKRI